MSAGRRAGSPQRGVGSPKRAVASPQRARNSPKASSPSAGRRERKGRPLSPAEQKREREAAKKAYLERRHAVEEEGVALEKEHEELIMEVARLDAAAGEGGPEGSLARMAKECDRLTLEVSVATDRLEAAERRRLEIVARHAQQQAKWKSERSALAEELDALRRTCAEKEDEAQRVLARLADTRERFERGADELQQLRTELWQRQSEKASLVADQASAARVGAEQRAQAVATEAHVTALAQALDCEDMRVVREQRRLRRAVEEQGERIDGERRQLELASNSLPDKIREERKELERCKKVAESRQLDVQAVQEALARTRTINAQLADKVRATKAEAWCAEGLCDAARTARQALEAEAANVEAEIQQLKVRVDTAAEENRTLLFHHIKTKNFHAGLLQDRIRQDVKDYMKAYPKETKSPSLAKATAEVEARAARLNLAGIGTTAKR